MESRDYDGLRARESRTHAQEREIKVIAAATDFTNSATSGIQRAAQLSRANGSQLHLFHVVSPLVASAGAVFGVLGVDRDRLGTVAAASRLRRAAARLAAEFDVHVEMHLRVGSAPDTISALTREVHADLLVLGNHRRNFVAEVLGINTALQVQRKVDVPLLAVSNPARRRYASVLLVSDLSEEAARAGQCALRFFPDSKLTIVHSAESHADMLFAANAEADVRDEYRRRAQHEAMERLRTFAQEASLDAALRVELAHPTLVAQRYARTLGVDLVVLRPTKRWITSGVAYHLAADPPCDLLLMP